MADEFTTTAQVQQCLDLISDTPGAILVRGPDRWIGLVPDHPGQILVADENGMPQWIDP